MFFAIRIANKCTIAYICCALCNSMIFCPASACGNYPRLPIGARLGAAGPRVYDSAPRGAQRQPLQCNAGVGVHSVRTLEASLVTLWRVLQHLILMPPFPPWWPHKAPTFGGLLLAFLATCRTKNASRRIIILLYVSITVLYIYIFIYMVLLISY